MTQQIGSRVCRDSHSRRPQRRMGIGDADQIDQQRHGQDRPAAAEEAEAQPHETPREEAQEVMEEIDLHREAPAFPF